ARSCPSRSVQGPTTFRPWPLPDRFRSALSACRKTCAEFLPESAARQPWFSSVPSWEEHLDQADQQHVSENDEERGDHHGTGSRTLHTFGTPVCPHPLKTGDQSNDQPKNGGLERRRQKIVEGRFFEAMFDEESKRNRLRQCGRDPAKKDATEVRSKCEQWQHYNARQNTCRHQILVGIDGRGFHCVNLLGDFHGAQFCANSCSNSSADDQPSYDRAALLADGQDEELGEQRLGAKADQAVMGFKRKNNACRRARQCYERQRFRAQFI